MTLTSRPDAHTTYSVTWVDGFNKTHRTVRQGWELQDFEKRLRLAGARKFVAIPYVRPKTTA